MFGLPDLNLPGDGSFLAKIVITLQFVLELGLPVDPSPSVAALAGFLQFYVILPIPHLHVVDRNHLILVALLGLFAFPIGILVKFFFEGLFGPIRVGIAGHLLAYFRLHLVLDVSVANVGWFPSSSTH